MANERRMSSRRRKGPVFRTVTTPPQQHDELRRQAFREAREEVDRYQERIDALHAILREHNPLAILSCFAFYGLQGTVGPEGIDPERRMHKIQQHHAELLQAIILSIPLSRWGTTPADADAIQAVFNLVPPIAATIRHRRIVAFENLEDPQEIAVRALQERVRLHTQGVRNWGYLGHVKAISRELYSPLDAHLQSHLGFGASDVIAVAEALLEGYERRVNQHLSTMRKVARASSVRQMARTYYKLLPDLPGTVEKMLAIVPKDATRDGMLQFIMVHHDQRLLARCMFKAGDLVATGLTEEVIERVLTALAISPDEIGGVTTDTLFLDNPIWDRPLVGFGESYVAVMPQALFSHVHRVMDRLAKETGLQEKLKDKRAVFLERKVEVVLAAALPDARIRTGLKWRIGPQQFETDLLAIADRVVLIAEAKSHRLTPEGLRGAPERVRRHIKEIVLQPSVQSARLESLIRDAQAGDAMASSTVRGLGIDPDEVDRVIRLSVTLDDFSVLASAERQFKEVGWVDVEHDLAPTIGLADLVCVTEILHQPIHFVHYLHERARFQKTFQLFGDELDFLGLYLETGLNLDGVGSDHIRLNPTGMSAEIDRYYMSMDAGVHVPKPRPRLSPHFSAVLRKLGDRRRQGWLLSGIRLLESASYRGQMEVEPELTRLRARVLKTFRDAEHANSLVIEPEDEGKAAIVFYFFPERLRHGSRDAMRQMATQVLDRSNRSACIVFGALAEPHGEAFEALVVAVPTGDRSMPDAS